MINVSYQQVQKYEAGKNRMSAGLLYEISDVLGISITYFFEDIEQNLKRGRRGKSTKSLRPDQLNTENDE